MTSFRKKTQYSVFLENKVGALADLCNLIADRSINLPAVCAIDTVEEAVLRVVAEDDTAALAVLKEAGLRVVETQILLIELENAPGATGRVAAALARSGVNIDYIYAAAHESGAKAHLVLRTHQNDEAEKTLREME